MFKKILHRIVANPWVYDRIQVFFGARQNQQRVAQHISAVTPASLILDLGGGTGIFREIWPSTCTYICLDNDIVKLRGFLNKYTDGTALLADATRIPIRSNSVDFVLCTSMSHHVHEDVLAHLIQEGIRVLKGTGKFIFMDGVLRPESWKNRFLWKLDRGLFPHTEEVLRSLISSHFQIIHWEKFSIYLDCIFAIGIKYHKD